jgi:hypothetical protein
MSVSVRKRRRLNVYASRSKLASAEWPLLRLPRRSVLKSWKKSVYSAKLTSLIDRSVWKRPRLNAKKLSDLKKKSVRNVFLRKTPAVLRSRRKKDSTERSLLKRKLHASH